MDLPRLADFDDPGFDPLAISESTYSDPIDVWSILHALAAKGSVHPGDFRDLVGLPEDVYSRGRRLFMVLGTEDIRTVINTPDLFDNQYIRDSFSNTFGKAALPTMDPPQHTHFRKIFQKAFLPHAVTAWGGESIDPVVNGLIDNFIGNGRAELVGEFISRFPFDIIFRQLDLPPAEAAIFHKMSVALQLPQMYPDEGREAHDKLGAFFKALIDQRRANPGRDLISELATVEVDGERLSDEAVISFFRIILGAAGDTAYRTTGAMMVALLWERPDQFEAIKADHALIPRAVEEALRWEAPVNITYRYATRDTELGGVAIPAGSLVQAMIGLASRDPAIHADPDRFDMTRPNGRAHLGFGGGPHICLGQHLARFEMARAVEILLTRLPRLRPDPDFPRPAIQGSTMRTAHAIHVRFD